MSNSKRIVERTTGKVAVRFSFDGENFTARKRAGESLIDAVTRSFARRVPYGPGGVHLWYSSYENDRDVYTAKRFNSETDTFEETEIGIPR